jgi:hypothetical protein
VKEHKIIVTRDTYRPDECVLWPGNADLELSDIGAWAGRPWMWMYGAELVKGDRP